MATTRKKSGRKNSKNKKNTGRKYRNLAHLTTRNGVTTIVWKVKRGHENRRPSWKLKGSHGIHLVKGANGNTYAVTARTEKRKLKSR